MNDEQLLDPATEQPPPPPPLDFTLVYLAIQCRLWGWLLRLARSFGYRDDDALDLLQSAALKMFSNWARLGVTLVSLDAALGYFARTATCALLDANRKRRRWQTIFANLRAEAAAARLDGTPSREVAQLDAAVAGELQQRLATAFAELPDDLRAAWLLSESLPLDEAGKRLGVAPSTVAERRRRVRARLLKVVVN